MGFEEVGVVDLAGFGLGRADGFGQDADDFVLELLVVEGTRLGPCGWGTEIGIGPVLLSSAFGVADGELGEVDELAELAFHAVDFREDGGGAGFHWFAVEECF